MWRGRPAPTQTNPAVTVTAAYFYDALNRPTAISYSDGAAPVVWNYDQSTVWGSFNVSNPIGRLTNAYVNGLTSEAFSYDPMGRVVGNAQAIYNQAWTTYFTNFGYDGIGDMTSYSNGAGVTFTQTFDTAGRITSLTSSWVDAQHPATLAVVDPSMGYYPTGQLRVMTLGNGLTQTNVHDGMMQPPCRIELNSSSTFLAGCADTIPTGNLLDLGYVRAWGSNNGNVTRIDTVGLGQSFSRSFTYDVLNNLVTMSSPNDPSGCTGLSWNYDAWGNRTDQVTTGGSCGNFHASFAQGNNRMDGYSYDAAGNLLNDGTHTYFYNAESQLIQVDGTLGTWPNNCASATACYVYDAEGRRVEKRTGGNTTDYAYDLSGKVMTEFQGGSFSTGYAYFSGQLLAQYSNGTTYFALADPLGSTRLLTGMNQALVWCNDYLPFGERLTYSGCSDTGVVTHKFTGKERDSESGNDNFGARYFGSSMGRFLSPDPTRLSAFIDDPQTWNMYTYAHNNPLAYVDRNGKWPTPIHNQVYTAALGQALTPEQMQIVESVSKGQDDPFTGGQSNSVAFEHAMRAPDQTVSQAETEYNNFVSGQVQAAQEAQIKFWMANPGSHSLSNDALVHFAMALHAVTDSTSPAHAGFQLWNWINIPLVVRHRRTESSITPQQRQTAVSAAQGLFEQTFGMMGFDEFDLLSLQEQQQQRPTQQVCSTIGDQTTCQTF